MISSNSNSTLPASEFGTLLRYWRDLRGKSQLDLALDAGISQRHVSFVESGRSVPGRQTLLEMAQALDIPLRDRNALLLAAGYAPLYAEGTWNAREMQSIAGALGRMLRQQEPYPAMVMDRYWNVIQVNDAAPRFFGHFIDMAARPSPRNLLHLMFDPAGMRPLIANWESVARSLIQRVYRESVGRVVDEKTQELLTSLLAYPEVKAEWMTPKALGVVPVAPPLPMIPLGFLHDGVVLNYFSMITTVGAPQTVAAQELRVECLFPADEETEGRHVAILGVMP